MSISDPRGGNLRSAEHKVQTLAAAQEWCEDVTEDDLPISVEQRTASGGRRMLRVFSADLRLLRCEG